MTCGNILDSRTALREELHEIESRRRRRAGQEPVAQDKSESYEQIAKRLQPSALCLSGGGIRSATFCLGVLQILARRRMLSQFDYLSTVSGGGFIGGWLQVLIRESGGVEQAQAALGQPRPEALRRLRAYTNYLTPQTGPLSADTWAGIVLYLRNLLINWAVFAPLFLLITLIPIFYRTAMAAYSDHVAVNLVLLVCAGLLLMGGMVCACSLLPSHRPPRSAIDATPDYASAGRIRWGVVYPALGWTLFIPVLLDMADGPLSETKSRPWLGHHAYWIVPALYVALMTLGFALAWWRQSHRDDPAIALFRTNFVSWFLASLGSGLLTWLMLSFAGSILPLERAPVEVGGMTWPAPRVLVDTATALTVFAPIALAVIHVLQTALYVALRRESELADLDREWLGRVNAMILRLAAGWTVFALCCLIFPVLLSLVEATAGGDQWSSGSISAMTAITMAIGGLAAWLGKIWPSIEELSEKPAVWELVRAYLPVALGVLFVASLLIVFGGVLNFVLAQLQVIIGAHFGLGPVEKQSKYLPLLLQLFVGGVLLAGVITFRHVNVNRFSMHAIYRNRLTRAFLGSARNKREQDPLTGFDPQDNSPLSSLRDTGNSLFPVINMTLNITAGSNTAWAERQAASFTATPLVSGSAALRHPLQMAADIEPGGAFVPTLRFAGLETLKKHPTKATEAGAGLGSALTVSGAAVSPTWGYHSSRITAFLMTLFNVRLGVWLPNPSKATADELRLARPRNSLMALINEMLGETTDDSQAIYLSDGGHFENLGLYEMFRRQCNQILVVDAGADELCSLFDLGNAIRKAEIDLGIKVTMREPLRVYGRNRLDAESELHATALGFASGTIDYGEGQPEGTLLYIKPSFLPAIPADVRSYGAEHKSFPHESTLDQWFSESQFESYRMLGQYQMEELVGAAEDSDLPGMFETAATRATRPPAPADEAECAGMRTLASVIAGRFPPPPDGTREAAE